MAVINVKSGELQSKGKEFEEYAANLLSLLSGIDEKVQEISNSGIKGSAAGELMERYETIHNVIANYAGKIQALGSVIQGSAAAKANVNEAALKAAGGSAV
ncbi:MAG: hypothetical protein UFG06_07960 [Lachnospiraceae bacterium]|nr:hypothetical protein [Lachnospiraceae bacterium]